MSRSQKRQYGTFTEYNEAEFVGLRDNNNQGQQGQGGGRFYTNGSGGGGGRGRGMRKHQQTIQNQQPRTFYVNAEFLHQNATEFQNAISMNGIRRRVGWGGGVLDSDPCNMNMGRHQMDNIRPHSNNILTSTLGLEDHCETSRETITDISVTVPSNRRNDRNEEERGGGGFMDCGNGKYGNIHNRDKQRPRSRQTGNNNNNEFNNNNHNNSSNFRKKRRRSDSEGDRDRDGRRGRRHKKSRRPSRRVVRDEDEQDSGDIRLSSPSDDLEIEEDDHEDLRNTLVRQKIVRNRNKFRREPGEILDTDESTPTSSPKPDDKNRDSRGKGASSSSKRASSSNTAVVAATSTSTKKGKDSGRVSSPELEIVGDSRPITAETLTKDNDENNKDSVEVSSQELGDVDVGESAESRPITVETPSKEKGAKENVKDSLAVSSTDLEIVGDTRPRTAEIATNKKDERNKDLVRISSPELEVVEDFPGSRPRTAETSTRKNEESNSKGSGRPPSAEFEGLRHARPTTAETLMEAKIKALRGRRTIMENEIETLKKNVSRSERHLKEAQQKLKKVELELKLKQEEVESLKRATPAEVSNDTNKPDVQLIYAMAYQDRLFVEVEKVKSAFEIEVLKLQEYYESRLSHYRSQGLHPGAFNNFPKGCVVTPLNMGQMPVGHQDQNVMARTESRSGQQQLQQQQSQQMGLFAHLGNPDSVAPPIMIPQGISRARLPVFLNPMMRRMQQNGGIGVMDSQTLIQTIQQQQQHSNQASSTVSTSSNSNNNNGNSNASNHIHNSNGNGGSMTPANHSSSFGR